MKIDPFWGVLLSGLLLLTFYIYLMMSMTRQLEKVRWKVTEIEQVLEAHKEYSPYHDNDPDDLYRNWQKNSYRWRKM